MMQIKTGRFKNKVECACAKHQSEIYKAFGNHNKICYLLALKSCNMTIIDTSDLPGLVLTRWADMQRNFSLNWSTGGCTSHRIRPLK